MENNPDAGKWIGGVGLGLIGLLIGVMTGGAGFGLLGALVAGFLGYKAIAHVEAQSSANVPDVAPVINPAAQTPPQVTPLVTVQQNRMTDIQTAAVPVEPNKQAPVVEKQEQEKAAAETQKPQKKQKEKTEIPNKEEEAKVKALAEAKKLAEENRKKNEDEAKKLQEAKLLQEQEAENKRKADAEKARIKEEQLKAEALHKKQEEDKYNAEIARKEAERKVGLLKVAEEQFTKRQQEREQRFKAAGKSAPALPVVHIKPTLQGSDVLEKTASTGSWMHSASAPLTQYSAKFTPELKVLLEETVKKMPDAVLVKAPDAGDAYKLTFKRNGVQEDWHVIPEKDDSHFIQLINKNGVSASVYASSLYSKADDVAERIVKQSAEALSYDEKWRRERAEKFDASVISQLHAAFTNVPGASFKKIDEKGYAYALVIHRNGGEEKWYLDRTHDGRAQFVYANDPGFFFASEKYIGAEHILNTISRMYRDAKEESADPAQAMSFDLPKDRPIGYLGLSGMGDAENTKIFKTGLELLDAYPEMLARCGYDMVCLDDKQRVTTLRDNPAAAIDAQIAELRSRGVHDFYLNFDAHGSPDSTSFAWDVAGGKGHSSLQPQEMCNILLKYSDCRFTFNSPACHGGGNAKMMRQFQDYPGFPEGRVTVITHTKEETVNYDGYNDIMTGLLHDMAAGKEGAAKNYGEAHRRADYAAQRQKTPVMCNPEFWKSMPAQPSKRTAQNDAPDRSGIAPDPLLKAAEQYHAGYKPAAASGEQAAVYPGSFASAASIKGDRTPC